MQEFLSKQARVDPIPTYHRAVGPGQSVGLASLLPSVGGAPGQRILPFYAFLPPPSPPNPGYSSSACGTYATSSVAIYTPHAQHDGVRNSLSKAVRVNKSLESSKHAPYFHGGFNRVIATTIWIAVVPFKRIQLFRSRAVPTKAPSTWLCPWAWSHPQRPPSAHHQPTKCRIERLR
jgi:hypothetical protein